MGRITVDFAVLGLIVLCSSPIHAAQATTIQPGQRFHVVALRDARLFAMCFPDAERIKAWSASADYRDFNRPGNNKLYIFRDEGCYWRVLFTDGEDTHSRLASAGDALARVEESGVPVFVVQYETRASLKSSTEYLQKLSSGSGGWLFRAKSILNVGEAFSKIADELRSQYTICYYPSNPARNGESRRISVFVDRPGLRVRASSGYRARLP